MARSSDAPIDRGRSWREVGITRHEQRSLAHQRVRRRSRSPPAWHTVVASWRPGLIKSQSSFLFAVDVVRRGIDARRYICLTSPRLPIFSGVVVCGVDRSQYLERGTVVCCPPSARCCFCAALQQCFRRARRPCATLRATPRGARFTRPVGHVPDARAQELAGAEVSRRKGGKRTHACADAYSQASAFEGISSAAADAASVQVRGLPAF